LLYGFGWLLQKSAWRFCLRGPCRKSHYTFFIKELQCQLFILSFWIFEYLFHLHYTRYRKSQLQKKNGCQDMLMKQTLFGMCI
jgi:hypothetical protein